MRRADPDERSALPCVRPPVSKRSRAAISWPRRDAFPIPPASGSKRPASSWTLVATFASMSGWRRRRPMFRNDLPVIKLQLWQFDQTYLKEVYPVPTPVPNGVLGATIYLDELRLMAL